MTKRYDLLSARPQKNSDKPYWHKVGTMWQREEQDGSPLDSFSIVFDSLPLPDKDGRVSILAKVPLPRQDYAPAPAEQPKPRAVPQSRVEIDDIPF